MTVRRILTCDTPHCNATFTAAADLRALRLKARIAGWATNYPLGSGEDQCPEHYQATIRSAS